MKNATPGIFLMTRTMRLAGVVMMLVGAAVYLCYRADRVVLRPIARGIVHGVDSPAERVLAVNTWYFCVLTADRSGNAQWYINAGSAEGAASITTQAGTLANAMLVG